jgi:hypothetical protein
MLPKLRKLSRASEVIARMILLRAGSGRSHLSKRAFDVRCPVFKVLTETKARRFLGGLFVFIGVSYVDESGLSFAASGDSFCFCSCS